MLKAAGRDARFQTLGGDTIAGRDLANVPSR